MNPTQSIAPTPPLIIKDTKSIRGRGVFATVFFPQGSVVEISPVIEVSFPWDDLPPDIKRVVYDWGYLLGQESGQLSAVALGVGSLFNHTNTPNVSFHADRHRLAMVFTAMRDIHSGEELTIDYNSDIDPTTHANWFDLVGIEQLP